MYGDGCLGQGFLERLKMHFQNARKQLKQKAFPGKCTHSTKALTKKKQKKSCTCWKTAFFLAFGNCGKTACFVFALYNVKCKKKQLLSRHSANAGEKKAFLHFTLQNAKKNTVHAILQTREKILAFGNCGDFFAFCSVKCKKKNAISKMRGNNLSSI